MIFLKIGSYTNKGDGLMLHSVINRLQQNHDIVTLAQIGSYQTRARLGLFQAMWFDSLSNWQNSLISNFIPKFLKKKYGLVSFDEIEAVVDASGFAYGDQWGHKKITATAKRAEFLKKKGKKIILLPQSLGPFTGDKVRKSFIKLVENSDLIFARDKTSLSNAKGVADNQNKIKYSPDFTGNLAGIIPNNFSIPEKPACIIPNHRMIDSTDQQTAEKYIPFLKSVYNTFEDKGMSPFVLVHEHVDYSVALELQNCIRKKIKIIYDDNPLVLRGILSKCYIVLSSRFHGLISTLSQSVPCLATRWSHKFERLMEEYKIEDYLVSPLDSVDLIHQKIELLDNAREREAVIDRISNTVASHIKMNEKMWEEVEELLKK